MSYELPNDIKPAFNRSQTACKCEKETRTIKTATSAKTRSNATQTNEDELFQTSYIPDDCEQTETVMGIMKNHSSVLSITRPNTKSLENTFLKIRQIVNGEFLYSYTWDRNWFNRVSKNFPVEDLKFNWETLVSRLNDVLDYVVERQSSGYWWPTKRNGKMKKSSLSDFLACPMKSKNFWSPFLEIACGDCITPKMLRNSLGVKVCQQLDEILKDVWFQKDFNTMVNFYKGVCDLKRWLGENRENLISKSSENNYQLSSFVQFIERIKQCNLETKCVGPSFIGPWSNKWSVLKDWFYKVHGVTL